LACVFFPLPSIPSIAISNPRVVMSPVLGRGRPPVPHSVSAERATCNGPLDCDSSNRPQRSRGCNVRIYWPAMANPSTIRENLQRVRQRIAAAAPRASRKPEEILLIGVSKTHPADAIREAYDAGLRHFGENRVQEWEGKLGALADLSATWHLIGHLQSNKAARAAKAFHSVDSVDDWSLAQRLDRAQAEKGTGDILRVLIEVHMGGEETKSGVSEADLPELSERILTLVHLEFAGLMCIPPFRENPEEVRPLFETLRKLKEQLESRLRRPLPTLSMGMSHDFEAAILEGSTEVRIGTAIFGTRPKNP
jgi:pyridoxal phosphate enzyme (YggS family)